MSEAHFRFSPNILARLGEELNQAIDQSVLELIKNSYDADASVCEVYLHNVAKPGGTLRIRDNGKGMARDQISNSWLVLGKSEKTAHAQTALGRTPAGNKGLGRLAALRMGRNVKLHSVSESKPFCRNELRIDWKLFDGAPTVEDVTLEITDQFIAPFSPEFSGTVIEIGDLRDKIDSDALAKLARAILLLTDPFQDETSGFDVRLVSDEFKEISDLLKEKYFEDAEFHLVAKLDETGRAYIQLLDWQGNVLVEGGHEQVKGDADPYRCSSVVFDMWIFKLGGAGFLTGRKTKTSDLRKWLRNFGGVHVYQDGIRVSPYGSPGDDWLGINLSRVRNPEERPGTNTSIGRIFVSNRGNYRLTQKTDRSGFIDDEVFLSLKTFARDALEWMANWRLEQAEIRRDKEREEAPKASDKEGQSLQDALLEAPPAIKDKLLVAFESYKSTRDRETDSLRREVQLYRTLSTAGITAATFAHESHGNPIKTIDLALNVLERRIPKLVDASAVHQLSDPVSDIKLATGSLSTLSAATLNLVKADKRRVGRTDIYKVIHRLASVLQPFLTGRETELQANFQGGEPYLRCSEAAIESIFTNLINNSLNAFRRAGTVSRKIIVEGLAEESNCVLSVFDSGPGIEQKNIREIWLPGITSDPDGTGLGLTIVKDTVKDLGGKVEAIPSGKLGGAVFIVTLPIIGK